MAKTATITLNDDNYSTDWTENASGGGSTANITQTDTEIDLSVPGNTGGQTIFVETATTYDLTESEIVVQMPQAGMRDSGSAHNDRLYIWLDANNYYFWRSSNGALSSLYNEAGSGEIQVGIGLTLTNGDWLRIRETGGTVYFERAADSGGSPGSWGDQRSRAAGFTLTAITVRLYARQNGGGGSETATAKWDKVNESPAGGGGGNPWHYYAQQ